MSVKDNIKKHFKEKLNGELLKISVPEWETDIYYKPTYSFAVESKIIALSQQGKTVEALVEGIIQKALDPDGKPMFNSADKNMFMYEADPNIILRVGGAINNATVENSEEVSKN